MKSARRRRHDREGDPNVLIFLAIVTAVTATFFYFSITTYMDQGWNGRIKLRAGFMTVQSGFTIACLLLIFQLLMVRILLLKRSRDRAESDARS